MSGIQVTISGKTAITKANKAIIIKKGKAALETYPIVSPVKPWIMKRLKPTGGVICASWIAMTIKIPNQILV